MPQYNYCLPLKINKGIEQWNSDLSTVFFSQSFWKNPFLRLKTHNKSGLLDWKCSKTPWKVVTFSEVENVFWSAFYDASTTKSSSLYSGVLTNNKFILVLKRLLISCNGVKTSCCSKIPDLKAVRATLNGLNL